MYSLQPVNEESVNDDAPRTRRALRAVSTPKTEDSGPLTRRALNADELSRAPRRAREYAESLGTPVVSGAGAHGGARSGAEGGAQPTRRALHSSLRDSAREIPATSATPAAAAGAVGNAGDSGPVGLAGSAALAGSVGHTGSAVDTAAPANSAASNTSTRGRLSDLARASDRTQGSDRVEGSDRVKVESKRARNDSTDTQQVDAGSHATHTSSDLPSGGRAVSASVRQREYSPISHAQQSSAHSRSDQATALSEPQVTKQSTRSLSVSGPLRERPTLTPRRQIPAVPQTAAPQEVFNVEDYGPLTPESADLTSSNATGPLNLRDPDLSELMWLQEMRIHLRTADQPPLTVEQLDKTYNNYCTSWTSAPADNKWDQSFAVTSIGIALGDLLVEGSEHCSWVVTEADSTPVFGVRDSEKRATYFPVDAVNRRWLAGNLDWIPGFIHNAQATEHSE